MKCGKCGESIKDEKLLKHLKEYHAGENDINTTCPICKKLFNTIPSFHKHWYKEHHVKKKFSGPTSTTQEQGQETVSTGSDPGSSAQPVVLVPHHSQEDFDEHHISTAPVETAPETHQQSVAAVEVFRFQDRPEDHQETVAAAEAIRPQDHHEDYPQSVAAMEVQDQPEDDQEVVVVAVEASKSKDHADEKAAADSESSESSESEESDGEVLEDGVELNVTGRDASSNCETVNEAAAEFLLNLREKCNVPIRATKDILCQTENLVRGALQDFADEIDSKLKARNETLSSIMNVKESINATTKKLFNNLRTEGQQSKYFKDKLGVVDPVRFPIGREFRRVRRKHKSSMQTVIVQEEYIYVPVVNVVEKLVGHPDYKRFVEEGAMSSNSDVLDSYMKGEKSKKNSVLRSHPDALRFVLYYDDLEVCSPLKSKAGKQKLGAFYLYLDNIPLKYRSNLDMILVVGLVNANLVKGKKYGMDAALQHIVEDLKKFEDGIVFTSGRQVYGTLIATIGDNLGAHAIGGFKEGFTAHRFCRYCSVTYEEAQTMTKEDDSILRDKETHSAQCEKIQTSRGKNEKISTEYGVNRDSLLNNLRSYHVVEGLPPDLLHDILEGALPITVKKFLNHHLYEIPAKERKFTLEWLNSAILDFDYEYFEVTDKPSELKKDYITDDSTSLHQSGCQMWMLATILPLILGPHISVHDLYYQNFLDLLEISRIVFSNEISKWMVVYLKDLIETYLSNYIELYGPLIPKQHFLLHYPSLILLLGPLIQYMCMRCEAKHKYFKKIVNSLGNYKHVPWTLSKKHQLSQSVAWRRSLLKAPKVGPFSWKYVSEISYMHLLDHGIPKVIEVSWIEYNGVKFVQDKSFICVDSNDSLPLFCKIMKILIYPSCVFVCQKVRTRLKNVHLAAYEIHLMPEYCMVKPQEMILPKVFHPHRALDRNFIIMKQCAQNALF